MILSDEPGNARVLRASYQKLRTLRDRSGLIIFPGFFGYSTAGNVVTFPRGGSDITGAILAAAIVRRRGGRDARRAAVLLFRADDERVA